MNTRISRRSSSCIPSTSSHSNGPGIVRFLTGSRRALTAGRHERQAQLPRREPSGWWESGGRRPAKLDGEAIPDPKAMDCGAPLPRSDLPTQDGTRRSSAFLELLTEFEHPIASDPAEPRGYPSARRSLRAGRGRAGSTGTLPSSRRRAYRHRGKSTDQFWCTDGPFPNPFFLALMPRRRMRRGAR
jgi:hypothetical protein